MGYLITFYQINILHFLLFDLFLVMKYLKFQNINEKKCKKNNVKTKTKYNHSNSRMSVSVIIGNIDTIWQVMVIILQSLPSLCNDIKWRDELRELHE